MKFSSVAEIKAMAQNNHFNSMEQVQKALSALSAFKDSGACSEEEYDTVKASLFKLLAKL